MTDGKITDSDMSSVEGGMSVVETAVQRLIAAAERGGYKRAIAALRRESERQQLDRNSTGWAVYASAADYLESLTTEGTKP